MKNGKECKMSPKETSTYLENYLYYKEGYKYWVSRTYKVFVEFSPPFDIHGGCNGFVDFVRHSDRVGLLVIHKGFPTDGPSGPTIDTLSKQRGAFVHDALYWLIREGHLDGTVWRERADLIAYRIWKEDEEPWEAAIHRTEMWFKALRDFADYADDPESERPEIRVPQ